MRRFTNNNNNTRQVLVSLLPTATTGRPIIFPSPTITTATTVRSFSVQTTITQRVRAQIYSVSQPVRYGALAAAFLAVFAAGVYSGNQDKSRQEQEGVIPDVENISKDILDTFEFRPDLAPTMIRLAFVLCNMRQKQQVLNEKKEKILKENEALIKTGSAVKKGQPMTEIELEQFVGKHLSMMEHNKNKNENSNNNNEDDPSVDAGWNICSSFDGLDEAVEVLGFHQLASSVSMQDLCIIAAITAIRFMRGPWEDLKFRYGRTDDLVEDVILREEKIKTMKLNERDSQSKTKKFFSAKRSKKADEGSFAEVPTEEKLKNPTKYAEKVAENIKKAIPSLTDEQLVALFALHGTGDYHSDVCGLERYVKPSRSNYIISSQYYRTLARLKFHPIDEIVRSKKNTEVLEFPQMLEAGIEVMGAQEGTKQRKVCACPVAEYCILLANSSNSNNKNTEKKESSNNNKNFSKYVQQFSDKEFGEQIWSKAFMSGMQSVFDGGVPEEKLRELPEGAYKIGGKSSWYGEKLPKIIRPDYY